MTRTISNSDDVIDSRDVIARIEELEGEREALAEAVTEAKNEFDQAAAEATSQDEVNEFGDKHAEAKDALQAWDDDVDCGGELKALKALADEAQGYCSDWRHGAGLIRESHFKDYAQQFAEDIGAIKADASSQWPYTCIDWEKAARELKMDYTEVDYDGVAYLVR